MHYKMAADTEDQQAVFDKQAVHTELEIHCHQDL